MNLGIPVPLTVWIAFCLIVIISTFSRRLQHGNTSHGTVGLALVLGFSGITISLIIAGYPLAFLLFEMAVWAFGIGITMIHLAVSPPESIEDTRPGMLAVSSSLRLIVALGVWLSL